MQTTSNPTATPHLTRLALTQAVEILYTGGPNSSKRHAINPDPSIRKTLCGRPVNIIGGETLIEARITCRSCRQELRRLGVLKAV